MAEVTDPSIKNDESSNDDSNEIVPFRVKVALGVGECTQAIYVFIAGFYLNVFFLETACLDPTYVGLIQLIGGIWDTINDPFVGMLSDRTRTRFGRRRPWLLGAAVPAGLAYFAIWQTLGDDVADGWKLAYYLMCYMALSASITSIQVQITSLTPELTSDYDERTALATYRLAIANVFALICLFIHSSIVQSFDQFEKDKGYRISAAIFSPLIISTALYAFWNIKEKWNEEEESDDRLTLCQSLRLLFTNKAFIIVELVYLCGLTAVILIQTNLLLYAKYIVDSEDSITYVFFVFYVRQSLNQTTPTFTHIQLHDTHGSRCRTSGTSRMAMVQQKIRKEANVLCRWYYRGNCGPLSVFPRRQGRSLGSIFNFPSCGCLSHSGVSRTLCHVT